MVPNDVSLNAGQSAGSNCAFDMSGTFIKTMKPELEADPKFKLPQVQLSGNKVITAADAPEQGGNVMAKVGDVSAIGRIRVFPALPWKWDFDTYKDRDVPPTWVNAFVSLKPVAMDGNVVMQAERVPTRPTTYTWCGPDSMSGYVMQADVMLKENKKRRSNVGIVVQVYNLWLRGNNQELMVNSWPPHIRMDKKIKFASEPDVWYRLKLRVDKVDDGCQVRGKVWSATKRNLPTGPLKHLTPTPIPTVALDSSPFGRLTAISIT